MYDNGVLLTKVVKRFVGLSEYFDAERNLGVIERTNALCVAGIMDGGTEAVRQMFIPGANGSREKFFQTITSQTFLVHYGRDAKNIAFDASEEWREFWEDICHRIGDLRIIASGCQLPDVRCKHSRDFFREMNLWTHMQQV